MQAKFEARKSLGQHFLRSEKAINQIVNALGVDPKTIFEIGPGEGVLTQKLLEAGHKVIVIEIDKRSIEVLGNDFRDYLASGQLKIINKDCLEVDYQKEILKLNSNEGEPLSNGEGLARGYAGDFVLVGNIPYYITGAIFRHTFEQKVLPKQAIFLVQKEVAQRVVAREKGKAGKESLLSVSVKIFVENETDVEIVDYVKAGSFSPPPKVDSAILNIKNIRNPFKFQTPPSLPLAGEEQVRQGQVDFWIILKAAFSQKRKFLMSNLKSKLSRVNMDGTRHDFAKSETFTKYKNVFEEIFIKNYGEKVRAEDIRMEHWKQLLVEL